MMKHWTFAVLLALFWIPEVVLGSTGSIRIQGEAYPDQVDLSSQFAYWTQQQIGGTCHIFAAAALYEAACFRKTGKSVDVSQAYMTYRHLLSYTGILGPTNFFLRYTFNKDSSTESSIFDRTVDGGFSEIDVGDLIRGEVLSESEMPFDQEFVDQVSSIGDQGRNFEKTYGMLQGKWRFREYAKDRLDRFVVMKLKQSRVPFMRRDGNSGAPYLGLTRDANLKECKQKKIERHMEFTPSLKKMVSLLSSGIPVLCGGTYTFRPGDSGGHASTIIGYRYNAAFPKNVEFLFRDSNSRRPEWGWSWGGNTETKKFSCLHAVWLQ